MEKEQNKEKEYNINYLINDSIRKRKLDFFIDSKYIIDLEITTENIIIILDFNGCRLHLYSEMKKEYTDKKMKLLKEISNSKYIGIDKMKNLLIYI